MQETSWSIPPGVTPPEEGKGRRLTPEQAAILAMIKANGLEGVKLRADLQGAACRSSTALAVYHV